MQKTDMKHFNFHAAFGPYRQSAVGEQGLPLGLARTEYIHRK